MAESAITVPFEEMEGSPVESFGPDGFNATRTLRCDWADRLTLAQQLAGDGTNLPQRYPHLLAARVTAVSIRGHDDDRPMPLAGDTTKASYAKALLTVEYGIRVINPTGGGGTDPVIVVEEDLEPAAEFLTQPAAGFKWGSVAGTPLKDEEAPGKLFKTLRWNYTRYFLPSVPTAVLTLCGKVNNASIASPSLGLTFATETLLYNPPRLRRQVTNTGAVTVTLAYSFLYKPQTHNKFWRAATQQWESIYKTGVTGAVKVYEPGDFSPLIG